MSEIDVALCLDDLEQLVRARRTSMFVNLGRSVPDELVERLCAMAQWAPNHKRTWPWRFAHLTGLARASLGGAFVADMIAADVGDEGKRLKTEGKYLRAPSIVVVGSAPPQRDGLKDDDRDAVAAGIQNLLLGATAAGLNSFWSTAPVTVPECVNRLVGFEPGTRIVGLIYLGWPDGRDVETPERPSIQVNRLGGVA